MIDQETVNRAYPLPHPDNMMEDDVTNIIDSFEKIDLDVNDLYETTTSLSSDLTSAKTTVQAGSSLQASSTGSGTAYEINLTPAPTALTFGLVIHMIAHVQNAGPATLDVNGLGTKVIKKIDGNDLKSRDILTGEACFLFYDGTNFQLINPKADQEQIDIATSNLMIAFEELQENHGGFISMEAGWSDSFANTNEQGADEANSTNYQHDPTNTLYKGSDPGDKNNDDNYDSEVNYLQQEWTNSFLSTSQATVTVGSPAIDVDTQQTGEFINWWRSGELFQAQSYTPIAAELYSVKVNLRSVGSPTHILTAKVYAESGDQKTGSALVTSTNTFNATSLTATFQEVEFLFSGWTPDGITKYVFAIEATDVGDASNYIQIEGIVTGSTFDGGANSYDGTLSTRDLQMKIFSLSASTTLSTGVWPTNCENGRISFDSGSTWHDIAKRNSDTQLILATFPASGGTFDYAIRLSKIDSGEVRLNRLGSLGTNTKLLLHMNGKTLDKSLRDYSASNHAITFNGLIRLIDAREAGISPKFGKTSLEVDTGYLWIPDHADWGFGTGDFTVEMWASSASSGTYIHHTGGWKLNNTSSTYHFGSSTATTTFSSSNWTHIAVSRSGTSLRFFGDGLQIGSTVTNSENFAGSGNLNIGANSGGADRIVANLGELRITKGEALYTANFTPPTTPFGPIGPKDECVSIANSTDTSAWLDINSASSTEVKGNEDIYYWLALDPVSDYGDGTEIKIGSFIETKIAGTSDIPLDTSFSDPYNMVQRTFSLPNSTEITHLGVRLGWTSGSIDTFTAKIMTENSSVNYSIHFVESFVPVNNSNDVTWYKLTNPYTTPGSGTIRMGFYWTRHDGSLGRMDAISGYATTDTQGSNGGANYGIGTMAPGWYSETKSLSCGYRTAGGTTFAWRSIVRNNGGAWQWNTNTDYGSAEAWTDATVNDMLHAISEAVEKNTSNRMDKTDLERISDTQWEETGGWTTDTNNLVRGVTIRSMSAGNDPSISQFRINHLGDRDAMDLKSKAYDPGFIPSEAYIWARAEHSDADGSGTFSVSRNGGSEWETVSMIQQGLSFNDIRIMRGTIDLNGQTSGQDLRCRYETASAKDQYLHSWGLQAKS